jgi:hypothetical protein
VDTRTSVQLQGWNLPFASLTQDLKSTPPGIVPLAMNSGLLDSWLVPFMLDTWPDTPEKEPNHSPANAQPVALSTIVNGRIDKPGDRDVFRFDAKAGSEFVAEVYARRLDSPLDSVLMLTDSSGRQLAFNDDHDDKGAGLTTHQADSWLTAKLPADGTYYLHLTDAQDKGGPEYAYRLRVGPPRPDFELRIVPSSVHVRGGASAAVTVSALRKDGFTGEIELLLKDAPPGFRLSGARIPAGQDQVRFTLNAPPLAQDDCIALSLQGRAMIQGQPILRPAVPAENMMQAFAYNHLVPAQEFRVTVTGRMSLRQPIKVLTQTPIKLTPGGMATVRIALPSRRPIEAKLELSEPPEGISLQSTSTLDAGAEIVIRADAAKVKPGQKGNLIILAFAEREPSRKSKSGVMPLRVPVATLPAIPFEIAGK